MLEDALVGESYEVTFTIPGVSEADSLWTVEDELPPGLTFDVDTGVLSGVPTDVGETSFLITGTVKDPPEDCAVLPGDRVYTLTIAQAP